MEYTVLKDVPHNEIMECINLAFSDYPIPIHLTKDTLKAFFQASDVDQSLSFCAYSEGVMVGFILNSSNLYQGQKVVFDAGTGVIPNFRGKGVFSSLYTFAEQELRKRGIKKYYLEVLQQNDTAKAIYEKQGFSIVRAFSVMKLSTAQEKSTAGRISCVPLAEFDFSAAHNLTLVNPSFEHSYHVIQKNAAQYSVIYTKDKSGITAFCVYSVSDGRVIELAYCSLADLKQTLLHLAGEYKTVIAKNIDTSYGDVMKLMLSIGFCPIASQYEMVKEF